MNINEISTVERSLGQIDAEVSTFHSTLKNYTDKFQSLTDTSQMTVLNNLMDKVTRDNFDPELRVDFYPYSTPFPKGVGTEDTGARALQLKGKPAYNKWMQIIKPIATIDGWTIVDDLGAEESVDDTKKQNIVDKETEISEAILNNILNSTYLKKQYLKEISNLSGNYVVQKNNITNKNTIIENLNEILKNKQILEMIYTTQITQNTDFEGLYELIRDKYKIKINFSDVDLEKDYKILRIKKEGINQFERMFGTLPNPNKHKIYLIIRFNENNNEASLFVINEDKKIVNNTSIIKFYKRGKYKWMEENNNV